MENKKGIQYYLNIIQQFLREKRHFFLILGLVIAALSSIVFFSTSYAALQPLSSLPDQLTSKTDGILPGQRSRYIEGVPPNGLPKRFYAVDSSQTEYDIYCLDRWLSQLGGVHYTKDSNPISDKGMAHLLSLIYPNDDRFLAGKTDDEKRYISQLTIWYYQDKKAGYSDNQDICSKPEYASQGCKKGGEDAEADTEYWSNALKSEEKTAIKASKYWSEMNRVITEALAYNEDNNYSISVNQSDVVFTVTKDGQYMESNYVTVSTTGTGFTGYVLTTDSQGITFYKESGESISVGSTVAPNTKFKMRVPIETVKKEGALSVSVNIAGSFTSKDAYLYVPDDREFQRALMGVMQQTPLNKNITLKIEYPMGSVKISKKDATTGKLLKGATLVVVDENQQVIDRWVSEEEEHVIDPIKAGSYTLKEEAAPDGYILNMEPVPFTVTARDTVQVEMKNTSTGGASITKTDIATGEELAGATLVVTNQAGREIARWVSTKEPHYIENLEDGTYTLKEVIAPDGYVLSTQTVEFKVEAGKTTSVTFTNEIQGKVKIRKTDLVTGEEVAGATLVITDQKGEEVERWVSTNTPHYMDALPDGTYTLTEEKAPDGYIKSSKSVQFQVTAGKTTEVEMQNEPYGKAKVIKVDSITREKLEGATLVVTDSSGKELDRWVSTKDAHEIDSLPKGTYTLTEEKAPDGYVQKKQSVKFTVGPGKTTEVEMENEPYGTVEIEKIDAETGEKVKGAQLVIVDKDGAEYMQFESSEEIYITALPQGEYFLKEIKAPTGYKILQNMLAFTVKPGETVKVSMQNVKEIDAPNTESHIPGYIYVIGLIFLLAGSISIGFAYKKNHAKVE